DYYCNSCAGINAFIF
nr:immunoglobulin light chain junction region [Macaca mulatta]MOW15496.1 immunoglobulin light chain junction region [Macaca mulatta]MOW15957.1 immunoglobulin light chain junction region [Macaca mulatta]MOW16732.1 immunoglobulin light chain junction region [Macaca mulatta]MOW17517.1 immunoglobulin light chain junction region [Macaca mulatta]